MTAVINGTEMYVNYIFFKSLDLNMGLITEITFLPCTKLSPFDFFVKQFCCCCF